MHFDDRPKGCDFQPNAAKSSFALTVTWQTRSARLAPSLCRRPQNLVDDSRLWRMIPLRAPNSSQARPDVDSTDGRLLQQHSDRPLRILRLRV